MSSLHSWGLFYLIKEIMKKTYLLSMVGLLMLMQSCDNKKKEQLEGNWDLATMTIDGLSVEGQEAGSPVIKFSENDQYELIFSGKTEKGTYTLSGNSLVLTQSKNGVNNPQELIIDSLDAKHLMYHNSDKGARVDMFWVKRSGGEEEEEERK